MLKQTQLYIYSDQGRKANKPYGTMHFGNSASNDYQLVTTVCFKKTSPTFLAVTLESNVAFS